MLDLTISIISHGHKRYIPGCLDSVFRTTRGIDFEVVLVLNRPEEGLTRFVRETYPDVQVMANAFPVGFSENNNRVYRTTRSRYFLLLNPDTVVVNDALPRLVRFLEERPRAGVCGPKLLYPDGSLQLSCRSYPTLGSVLVRRTPLRVLLRGTRIASDYTLAGWDHASVRAVDWLFGACLMVRRCAADAVGLLDEELFLFCEDIDWCYRLKRGGWEISYVPDAVVQHDLDDASYDRFLGEHRMQHYRSMYRYWRKNMVPGPGDLLVGARQRISGGDPGRIRSEKDARCRSRRGTSRSMSS